MLETIMDVDTTPDIWFQQTGTTAHTSVIGRDWLKSRFGSKVISHLTDFPWPPRSPDLSPLDFFLWSYVKEKVFSTRPSSIDNLKIAIREALPLIDQDTLSAVTANFEKSCWAVYSTARRSFWTFIVIWIKFEVMLFHVVFISSFYV